MALTQTTTSRTEKHNRHYAGYTLLRSRRLKKEYSTYVSPYHLMERAVYKTTLRTSDEKTEKFHITKPRRNSILFSQVNTTEVHLCIL